MLDLPSERVDAEDLFAFCRSAVDHAVVGQYLTAAQGLENANLSEAVQRQSLGEAALAGANAGVAMEHSPMRRVLV